MALGAGDWLAKSVSAVVFQVDEAFRVEGVARGVRLAKLLGVDGLKKYRALSRDDLCRAGSFFFVAGDLSQVVLINSRHMDSQARAVLEWEARCRGIDRVTFER